MKTPDVKILHHNREARKEVMHAMEQAKCLIESDASILIVIATLRIRLDEISKKYFKKP
jgi:hypothetical protein